MDLIELFQSYLPRWSEENMQPIPDEEHPDRWAAAWKDFQNSYLKEHHDEIVEYYKSMQFKTVGMQKKQEKEKIKEEEKQDYFETVVEEELSEWEKVKRMLNE